MDPIGPLMTEHRLIERMIVLIKKELENIKENMEINPVFIDTAVDFFRTYADKTHHGKEEDILFRELGRKPLSDEDTKVMGDLTEEHARARQMVTSLSEENKKYVDGDKEALQNILMLIDELCLFYPAHIKKEDEHFFISAMTYLNDQEKELIVQEFATFDKTMIHEKYKNIVEDLESK
ncbi:hemerythrin domain-containing protein [Patescibacteria group bacterium]